MLLSSSPDDEDAGGSVFEVDGGMGLVVWLLSVDWALSVERMVVD